MGVGESIYSLRGLGTQVCYCCTGSGEVFNVGQFLEETSPYMWALMGICLCIGFSVLGAGVIMGFVYSSKVIMVKESLLYTRENYFTGFLCNLLCGISVDITGLMVALADAVDPGLFMKVLIVKMFG
ncbi:hypothetical protein EI94DRAFT_1772024 [Lactarius quietus]|nr:hypothetical protein EI94DRAFT_1772024 [Lactarius quietus]